MLNKMRSIIMVEIVMRSFVVSAVGVVGGIDPPVPVPPVPPSPIDPDIPVDPDVPVDPTDYQDPTDPTTWENIPDNINTDQAEAALTCI